MLCITNFKKSELYGNSQASLAYKKKKEKLTIMVNAVLFQVNTSMMRSFCKETLLLPLFFLLLSLRDANKTLSHLRTHHV